MTMTTPALMQQNGRALDLKDMTDARVALGRHGSGVPTRASLAFLLDHARAREAVWTAVDHKDIARRLTDLGIGTVTVDSLAQERSDYVRRPDLGRRLSDASTLALNSAERPKDGHDVVVVVADGLSSSAVAINAVPLLAVLLPRLQRQGLTVGPVVLASQARVALADPVGEALAARLTIMLIGERPGLSAADSLGAYITYAPKSGTPDSDRNCVSNIRDGGLPLETAAEAIAQLVSDINRTAVSGVALKDALTKIG
jgi:ethanolamine ammonia-lyase small subunit